jgi:AraC-like DNA-binding protein
VLLRHEGFRRLCLARELLLELEEAPLSINDLAREVHLSPFHLIRQFEAVFGATPNQFRQAVRLERAKHLLAGGRYSVTDVCMEVGFSSLGSFSVLFTSRVGETPSAYRRRMRPMVTVPGAVPLTLTPGCLTLMGRLPHSAFGSSVRNFREA